MAYQALLVRSAWSVPATAADQSRGLLAYVRVELASGLVCDGLTVRRRARDGTLYLGFPRRTDASGGEHPILRPADDTARRTFEAVVFEALGITEGGK